MQRHRECCVFVPTDALLDVAAASSDAERRMIARGKGELAWSIDDSFVNSSLSLTLFHDHQQSSPYSDGKIVFSLIKQLTPLDRCSSQSSRYSVFSQELILFVNQHEPPLASLFLSAGFDFFSSFFAQWLDCDSRLSIPTVVSFVVPYLLLFLAQAFLSWWLAAQIGGITTSRGWADVSAPTSRSWLSSHARRSQQTNQTNGCMNERRRRGRQERDEERDGTKGGGRKRGRDEMEKARMDELITCATFFSCHPDCVCAMHAMYLKYSNKRDRSSFLHAPIRTSLAANAWIKSEWPCIVQVYRDMDLVLTFRIYSSKRSSYVIAS